MTDKNVSGPDYDHYTAELRVTKTVKPTVPSTTTYSRNDPPANRGRVVSQVTHLVINAKTLESLTNKLSQHIGLISLDDDE